MELIRLLGRNGWKRLAGATLAGVLYGISYISVALIIEAAVRSPGANAVMGLVLVAACLLHLGLRTLSARTVLSLSQAALYELRLDLCRRIIKTPQEKLQSVGYPQLVAIVTRDVESLLNAHESMVGLAINAVTITACLAYIGWLYWPLIVILPVLLISGFAVVERLRRWPVKYIQLAREQIDVLHVKLRDLINGSRELQLNRARAAHYVDQIIASTVLEVRRGQEKGLLGFSLVMNLGELLYFLSIGAVVFAAPHLLTMPARLLSTVVITLLFVNTSLSEALHAIPKLRKRRWR